ncbi:xylulose kinase-1 [Tanacetum coccineum]
MSTLTFADTHNMVAFLEKPAKSGFHEIIGFLNANQIRYALTVNPTIYTSCIEQFWATAKAKTVNGECQIQALIDKKKVIITETSIISDLHLEDAGVTQEETQQDDNVPTPSNDPPLNEEDLEVGKEKEIKNYKIQKIKESWGGALKTLIKPDVSLVDDTQGRSDDAEMFDTNDLHGDEIAVDMPVGEKQEQSAKEREVNTSVEDSATPTTIEEITLAQTLIQIKEAKPKVGFTRLLLKKEEEANIAFVIDSRDNIQAIRGNFQLAQRLQGSKNNGGREVKSKKGTKESSKGIEDELESDKSKKAESSEEKAKGSRKKILGKKRAGKEQQQESSKRQRIRMIKRLMSMKKLKILRRNKVQNQLIGADGSSKRYSSMIRMLQDIDREDFETLWKLVKIKHGDTRPEDEHERVLWGDLKVMFEPNITKNVWRNHKENSDYLEVVMLHVIESLEFSIGFGCCNWEERYDGNDLTLLAKNYSISLVSLKISPCRLSKLGKAFRHDVRLEDFDGSYFDKDDELLNSPRICALRELNLQSYPFKRKCQCFLIERCPNLEVLHTEDMCGDEGLQAFSKLERLDIRLCRGGLTDLGLGHIGKYGHNLKYLFLGNIGESDAGLVELSKGCPKLRTLEIRRCPFNKQSIASYVFNIRSLRYLRGFKECYDLVSTRPDFEVSPQSCGVKNEWGLFPKENVRVLRTAQLDVTKKKSRWRCKVSDAVASPNLRGFLLRQLRSDAIVRFLTPSVVRYDGVARNYDAVSRHCVHNSLRSLV